MTDTELIAKIAAKVAKMSMSHGMYVSKSTIIMDLDCVHFGCCPLKLQELLDANDLNLAHDVFGINRHLDTKTGKLKGFFHPRLAVPQ